MSLIDDLKKKYPEEGLLFAGVENLTDPKDMATFYTEYSSYLKETSESKLAQEDPERIAKMDIRWAAERTGQETYDRWNAIIKFD